MSERKRAALTAAWLIALHKAATRAARRYETTDWGTGDWRPLRAAWEKAEDAFEAAVHRLFKERAQ